MYSDYALIFNNSIQEIIFGQYYNCDQIAKQKYGETAFAVEVWSHFYPPTAQYPVTMGDTYANGKFFRNDTEITQQPTEAQIIEAQSQTIDDILVALVEG